MAKYNVYVEDVSIEAVFNKLGGIGGAKRFLADELTLIEKPKPEPIPEPPLDYNVTVDRSVKPSYPDWFKKLIHPCAGPKEFDLQAVEQWLHDKQKNGIVSGNTIYKFLKDNNALASCLNLLDGFAIQKKGIAVFRKLFSGKAVFLWGSVMQGSDGDLYVPCLCESGDGVMVSWLCLGDDWGSNDPALRFSK